VEETARQLRLRDIGGVIVIDLIDMERRRDSVRVLDALEAALKQDRARARIVQYSPSGLVEIIRRREGQSLRQVLHRSCPYCAGRGVVRSPQTTAIATRRRIRELIGMANPDGAKPTAFLVTLHPDVALWFLGSEDEYITNLEATTGVKIFLRVDPTLHIETSDIEAMVAARSAQWPQWHSGEIMQLSFRPPLYPAKEPRFIVHQNTFIKMQNEPDNGHSTHYATLPATIEIERSPDAGDGRWYFSGRVLTFHDPTPAAD
jgi:ribonuclease G